MSTRSDDPYGDPDLVSLYDADNPDGPDHEFYRGLADELDARVVVDLGCGTGLLTRTFARSGRRVIGVDPSETMLGIARSAPAAGVEWIRGEADDIPRVEADLVVCTGNVVMHFADGDFEAILERIAAALRPGGVLAFESRDPRARQWEGWTPQASLRERDTELGRLREWTETDMGDDGIAHCVFHTVMPDGEDRVTRMDLAFRGEDRIAAALRMAGFASVAIDGGWAGEPAGSGRLLVVRAVRS